MYRIPVILVLLVLPFGSTVAGYAHEVDWSISLEDYKAPALLRLSDQTCNLPSNESKTALINFGNGRLTLGVPRVYFRPDSFGRGGLTQRVDLVRVRF